MTQTLDIKTLDALSDFTEHAASILKGGHRLFLEGPIGAGKTTFTRRLLQKMGVQENVSSPTYTLIQEYSAAFPIYHMDLYRLENDSDIASLDLDRYLEDETALVIIEWADKLPDSFLTEGLRIVFSIQSEEHRRLDFDPKDPVHEAVSEALLSRP